MARRILFVTHLDVWLFSSMGNAVVRAGNQSMYNTLLGWDRAGWDVHVLTTGEQHQGIGSLGHGVVLERVSLPFQDLARRQRRLFERLRPAGNDRTASAAPATELDPATIQNPRRWLAFQLDMTRRVFTQCLRHRPDVLYGYEVLGAPVASRVGRLLGIPVVTRFQGTLLGKWLDRPDLMRQAWAHTRGLAVPADLVVMADDGTLGDLVLERLGVDPSIVRFWMNGVVKDDVISARESSARPDGDPGRETVRLFAASRLVQWKRVDRILDVLSRLPAGLPPWRMDIAGEGPERAALEQRARDLGLGERVTFLGQVPQDGVLARLVDSDVFLSLFDISNLGNGLLESFVAGIPVFALDVGGTSHLVQDGQTGVLVPPERLASEGVERLARLIADRDHRQRIGSAAASWARTGVRTWEERMSLEVGEVEAMLTRRKGGNRR